MPLSRADVHKRTDGQLQLSAVHVTVPSRTRRGPRREIKETELTKVASSTRRCPAMPLDLYYWPALAGCRSVLLVGDALNIKFCLHPLDVVQKEHLRQEFIAINPLKTVPTLRDGDLVIFESHAICTYLINRYAKDDFLYPKDAVRRAKVDQFLFFASGPLYRSLMNCLDPRKPKAAFTQAYDALSVVNMQLGRAPYIAGYHITVADFVLAAMLSAAEELMADFNKQANIVAWLQKCKADIPGYKKLNEPGLRQFVSLYNSKKKQGPVDTDTPSVQRAEHKADEAPKTSTGILQVEDKVRL